MPFANEHSARLRKPTEFADRPTWRGGGSGKFRRSTVEQFRGHDAPDGKSVDVIWGKLKGKSGRNDPPVAQSLRFKKDDWTETQARSWLKRGDIDYILFEPAKSESLGEERESLIEKLRAGDVVDIPPSAFTCSVGQALLTLANKSSDDGTRRFHILANSGRPHGHGWWGRLAINMDGLSIGRQDKPLLREHERDRIVGKTERIWVNDDKELEVEGIATDRTEDGREVIELDDAIGYPWQASIYVPPSKIRILGEDEVAEVNGHQMDGPGAIFEEAELREVSFCTLGADENTTAAAMGAKDERIQIQFAFGPEGRSEMPDELNEEVETEEEETPVEEPKEEAADGTEDEAEETGDEDQPEGNEGEKPAKKAGPVNVGLSEAAPADVERSRTTEILDVAMELGMFEMGVELVKDGTVADVAIGKMKDVKLKELLGKAPDEIGPNDDPEDKSKSEQAGASVEERCRAKWDASPEIREEFDGKFESYLAYTKADEKGLIRFYNQPGQQEG